LHIIIIGEVSMLGKQAQSPQGQTLSFSLLPLAYKVTNALHRYTDAVLHR